jgi:hypothetical protein
LLICVAICARGGPKSTYDYFHVSDAEFKAVAAYPRRTKGNTNCLRVDGWHYDVTLSNQQRLDLARLISLRLSNAGNENIERFRRAQLESFAKANCRAWIPALNWLLT